MELKNEHITVRYLSQDIMLMNPSVFDSGRLKKLITPTALIIIEGNLMKTYLNADIEFTEEDADHNIDMCWDFIKDRNVLHMIIPDPTTHIQIDVRNYRNERLESVMKAEAIVLKSLAHKILARAFMTKVGDKYPIKLVDSEQAAIDWFAQI